MEICHACCTALLHTPAPSLPLAEGLFLLGILTRMIIKQIQSSILLSQLTLLLLSPFIIKGYGKINSVCFPRCQTCCQCSINNPSGLGMPIPGSLQQKAGFSAMTCFRPGGPGKMGLIKTISHWFSSKNME